MVGSDICSRIIAIQEIVWWCEVCDSGVQAAVQQRGNDGERGGPSTVAAVRLGKVSLATGFRPAFKVQVWACVFSFWAILLELSICFCFKSLSSCCRQRRGEFLCAHSRFFVCSREETILYQIDVTLRSQFEYEMKCMSLENVVVDNIVGSRVNCHMTLHKLQISGIYVTVLQQMEFAHICNMSPLAGSCLFEYIGILLIIRELETRYKENPL